MAMDNKMMDKMLEEKGTPAEYREKYLRVGKEILSWRFQPANGAYIMGDRFILHEGMALRWLKGIDGVRAVLSVMLSERWRLECKCWGDPNRFQYQATFIRGVFPFRSVIKGQEAYSFEDAVLLAAVETLG